jgi:lipoprotein-anchoring transpeptidase ErfK/SrfK
MFRTIWTRLPAVPGGCIRMLNADVIDFYQRVAKGTPVVVL